MAKEIISRSPGSLILQIIVLLLVVVLLMAILYPQKLWEQQDRNKEISQTRMENISYAALFYYRTAKRHTSDLDDILAFAEAGSLKVSPAGFSMDRLTREESGIDSFQVEFLGYNQYLQFPHFKDTLGVNYATADSDSVVLTIEPLPRYDFAPANKYIFAADQPIHIKTEFRGDQGVVMFVGTQGPLRGQQLLATAIQARAADFIYSTDSENLGICPTTGLPYRLWVNVKVHIRAEVVATLEQDTLRPTLSSSPLLSSLMVFRMLKHADAKAKRAQVEIKVMETVEDSLLVLRNQAFLDSAAEKLRSEGLEILAVAIYDSLLNDYPVEDSIQIARWDAVREASYAFVNGLKEATPFISIRDSIVNARKNLLAAGNFALGLEKLRNDARTSMSESSTINTTADSIDFYSQVDLIQNRLFKTKTDSITQSFLTHPDVMELFNQFRYVEHYTTTKVDSLGVTISSPIEGEYHNPNSSLLDRLFSVGGEKHHGEVVNGDMSWSERR
ncbi:MAG: hypothetical protein P9M15_05980 [Candidatus Electryoneaceae bacterium]|nr:hypothetical protein [Candidatus Electryoneaceae bacterium]